MCLNHLDTIPPCLSPWKNYLPKTGPWCQKVWGTTALQNLVLMKQDLPLGEEL